MSRFEVHTLDNGLRICLEKLNHVPSAASGFLVQTGARDETEPEQGLSHFLEHMCFKGTANATWEEINQNFDRLGSNYNAFTSEEHTMYYGWVPAENLAAQTAILADMMRSSFPEEEFVTEKKVILEEIAMYRDNLARSMFDLATSELFRGSPLAHSVLGTEDTIQPMTRNQMVDYHRRRYGADNIIFTATGNLDADAIVDQLRQLTSDWKPTAGGRKQPAPVMNTGIAKKQIAKFKQQALMLCFPTAPGREDDARVHVLCNILSGENSRIFWEIIQQGICPHAGAFYLDYSDAGVFVLYALCEPDRADPALAALRQQAKTIGEGLPSDFEVERVKNAARTALANAGDSPMSRLLQLADDIDAFGQPLTLDEHLAKIEAVSPRDISALLEQYPISGEGMLVSVGPADWPT